MTCGSIEEKSEELKELLKPLAMFDRDKVMNIIVSIYEKGVEDGKYYSEGPKINLYGE